MDEARAESNQACWKQAGNIIAMTYEAAKRLFDDWRANHNERRASVIRTFDFIHAGRGGQSIHDCFIEAVEAEARQGSKMTQFHEGQEVEVLKINEDLESYWREAKIVGILETCNLWPGPAYEVQFLDGTRAVSDAEHIRAIL